MLNPFLLPLIRVYTYNIVMNAEKKKLLSLIGWPLIYFALIITICISGCMVFHRYYYCSVFVSGQSMSPTLLGGNTSGSSGIANFGIVDTSDYALKQLRRFDIVTTYYPWDEKDYQSYVPGQKERDGYHPERKIKRLLAMPNETIYTVNGNIFIAPTPVSQTTIEANKPYKLWASPSKNESTANYYFSANDWYAAYVFTKYDLATNVTFENASAGKYYFTYPKDGTKTYLNVSVNSADKNKMTADMTPSTEWSFNSSRKLLTTYIGNHSDSSLDGEYTFVLNDANNAIVLKKVSEINDSITIEPCLRENGVLYTPELLSEEEMENYPNYTNKILPFKRDFSNKSVNCKDMDETAIREGRYWVQGDHWSNSTDCHDYYPLYASNIEGILLAIEGTCTIGIKKTVKNGVEVNEKVCTNHKYSIPKVFR